MLSCFEGAQPNLNATNLNHTPVFKTCHGCDTLQSQGVCRSFTGAFRAHDNRWSLRVPRVVICADFRLGHSRAAQAVANIAGLRVTHLQQTAVLGATLCCHFAAVRLLLRLSADATRGPLPPCCDSRHASSRQMCGACGHVLGQVAEMKLGLQHCYGIRSNGNKPAGAKT